MIKHWRRPLRDIALIAAGLYAVSFLPPDTSLAERQKLGTLRYCFADAKNPLITDPTTGGAGPEHFMMQQAADTLGLNLVRIELANMKRSFNPGDWNVTRGQCDVLGGGLIDNATNRGFVSLLPTGQTSGLVLIGPSDDLPKGSEVGVFLGTSGFDRVKLSGWMREMGWRPKPLRDEKALRLWQEGDKPVIAPALSSTVAHLPQHSLPDHIAQGGDLAIGLWRGDMTLLRALSDIFPQNPNK